ncbi:unnamed protein product [Lampetra fluviatilis]
MRPLNLRSTHNLGPRAQGPRGRVSCGRVSCGRVSCGRVSCGRVSCGRVSAVRSCGAARASTAKRIDTLSGDNARLLKFASPAMYIDTGHRFGDFGNCGYVIEMVIGLWDGSALSLPGLHRRAASGGGGGSKGDAEVNAEGTRARSTCQSLGTKVHDAGAGTDTLLLCARTWPALASDQTHTAVRGAAPLSSAAVERVQWESSPGCSGGDATRGGGTRSGSDLRGGTGALAAVPRAPTQLHTLSPQ